MTFGPTRMAGTDSNRIGPTGSPTACECTRAGWCMRHRCEKSARLVELCRTRQDYYEQFERRQAPQQQTRRWRGLGDAVEWLLRITGIAWLWSRVRGGQPCRCAERQETLNRWWRWRD